MQRNNNGTAGAQPACAACKHQRKKCQEGCILAPYFPAERSREFQAVHKVFGVSNVTKMVKNIREEDRRRAVDSLVWEACCRQKDPVLGPYSEYKKVYEELKMYKSEENQMLQLTGQKNTISYKSLSSLVARNNGGHGISSNGTGVGGVVSSNGFNYFHESGNVLVEPSTFGYPSNYMQLCSEKTRGEKNIDSVVPLQQHLVSGGFNQQYYHSESREPSSV
ncbi:LOB domain-containing protein 2 isoform X2 [Ziziphus jujuba]|uniref:LOB domain-containing protein 2 isoform X2 n=1 Tax=Ziziphus jujuba TaxID=326968 RepID=A0ABM4A7Z4_ZIZJJ|nr:LOB domain-containing protein 2 isoform X2 [Ziziphus jujuba]